MLDREFSPFTLQWMLELSRMILSRVTLVGCLFCLVDEHTEKLMYLTSIFAAFVLFLFDRLAQLSCMS
jgi:hypothetical protein